MSSHDDLLAKVEQWHRQSAIAVSGDDPTPLVQLTSASAIVCQPIRWLWNEWLAKGKLHILAGAPGTGKTTIAIACAAIVSRGSHWPDNTQAPVGNVLVWSGEDDPADTLVPRLKAAGADLERVHFVGDILSGGEPRAFDPARDTGALTLSASVIGDVALMIVDPVVSAVAADSHKNTEVRRALQPIVDLASRLDCAVLGISHFSKGTAGRDPTERVTGSVAFGAVARVVMVTAKGEDGGRLLARSKSNIGPDGGGFSYDLMQTECEGLTASRVTWGGMLEGSARELIGDVEVSESPRDEAVTWLEQLLWQGPVPVKALKAEANGAGLSWRTVERAKADLGVEAVRRQDGAERGRGHWEWHLPDNNARTKPATPTTDYGGVKESQHSQGFQAHSTFKSANSESGGVSGGVTCVSCDGEGCKWCN